MDGTNPDIWIQHILSLKNALFVSTLSIIVAIVLAFRPLWGDWSDAMAMTFLFGIIIVCIISLTYFLLEAHVCSRRYSVLSSIRYIQDYADRVYQGDYSKIDELDLEVLVCRMGSRCHIDGREIHWGLERALELLNDNNPSMAIAFQHGVEEHVF